MDPEFKVKLDLGGDASELVKEITAQLEEFGSGLAKELERVADAEQSTVRQLAKESPTRAAQHLLYHSLQSRLSSFVGRDAMIVIATDMEVADSMETAASND